MLCCLGSDPKAQNVSSTVILDTGKEFKCTSSWREAQYAGQPHSAMCIYLQKHIGLQL